MKIASVIGLALFGLALAVLCFLAEHYRAERYQIIYTAFLREATQDDLERPAAICYSNEQLREAVKHTIESRTIGWR